jgi:hypothetical protein
MERLWWIVRIAVIVTASYCIIAPGGAYLRNARAAEGEGEGGGCNTSTSCARNSSNACYCPDVVIGGPGCTGCFVPNGSTGCGSCSGGPAQGN